MSASPSQKLGEAFVLQRRFAAPRALVFAALTQAEHLQHWMGPVGMVMSHCSVDLRPGGLFHYGLQPRGLADAPVMWAKWVFREISPPERLVTEVSFSDEMGGETRHAMAPVWPLRTLSTITLIEEDGKTLLTLDWRPLNAAAEEEQAFKALHDSMHQGWGGTMDQLAAHLATCLDALSAQTQVSLATPTEILTTRLLRAPRELVWRAFTESGHVERWWGPLGFSTTTTEMDVRVGGQWRHTMHGPDGRDWPNGLLYTRVEPPALLAWAHGDDSGSAPLFHCIVTFEARGNDTLLTLRHLFSSQQARDAQIAVSGAVQGAIGTTNRLADYLPVLAATPT